jgi:hypothetical protein
VRRDWQPILDRAVQLVDAFTARFDRPPTLRRLHYELVTDVSATAAGYRNVSDDYKELSRRTSRDRRNGSFPDMSENARSLSQVEWFADADDLREHVREVARVDRMAGQERAVCVAVEKDGSREFLHDWFDDFGVLVTSLNGYSSQTLIDKIARWRDADGRPLVVLYAGDHDATGEDIDRDFQARLGDAEIDVHRVALLPEHVERYDLPRSPFDKVDARAANFVARHGGLWQTELDALDPDILRGLFLAAFGELWDMSVFKRQRALEAELLADVLGTAA